jgi:hypothetical protein
MEERFPARPSQLRAKWLASAPKGEALQKSHARTAQIPAKNVSE